MGPYSHLQTEERGLGGKRPCQDLDLGLPASKTIRKEVFGV